MMADLKTTAEAFAVAVAHNRPRGVYVPSAEAQALLHAGWSLADECLPAPGVKGPHRDEVLLLPPGEAL